LGLDDDEEVTDMENADTLFQEENLRNALQELPNASHTVDHSTIKFKFQSERKVRNLMNTNKTLKH
jgi:hypothetical protein